MGANASNEKYGNGKRGRRGAVKNKDRLAAFAERAGGGSADWGGCDERKLAAVIIAITAMGGAVTFGLSRDLGAHSLTLMLDGKRSTLWFNGDADLTLELDGVAQTLLATE